MSQTKKFSRDKNLNHGYPATWPASTKLPTDKAAVEQEAAVLMNAYQEYKKDGDREWLDYKQLAVGNAYEAIKPAVIKDLQAAQQQLIDLASQPANVKLLEGSTIKDGTLPSDWKDKGNNQLNATKIKLLVGPPKLLHRMTEKAALYAICNATPAARPLVERVTDLLRCTFFLPIELFAVKDMGSSIIDLINKAFGNKLHLVKNNFIPGPPAILQDKPDEDNPEAEGQLWPGYVTWLYEYILGVKPPTSKSADSWDPVFDDSALSGKDTFFRNFHMLVRLDNETYKNGYGIDPLWLEVQVKSCRHYPTPEIAARIASGELLDDHSLYDCKRVIMDWLDYQMWMKHLKATGKTVLLDNPTQYLLKPATDDWNDFCSSVKGLESLTEDMSTFDTDSLYDAIDNSAWFKAASTSTK